MVQLRISRDKNIVQYKYNYLLQIIIKISNLRLVK